MSLVVAVPFGVGAAIVYGTSIVVQHRSAAAAGGGEESAAGLLQLLKDPAWVIAVLGDFIGFMLQAAALTTGPVVFVQPLVVLMLPVALVVHWYMGGPRPGKADLVGCGAIIAGLAVFLALIGEPSAQHIPRPRYVGMAIIAVLIIGVALSLAVTGRMAAIRGAMYGAVAGAYFGTIAVMVDDSSDLISEHGFHALIASPRGLVPLAGIVLLGISGIVLTQISFQVGALGATLPANLAADPLVAVLLGAVLLREHFPLSPLHLVAYIACLGAVIAGAIRLAAPTTAPVPGHGHRADGDTDTDADAPAEPDGGAV